MPKKKKCERPKRCETMDQGESPPKPYRCLEHINDEFQIIRRLMGKPKLCMSAPEIMDVIRLAIDRVHSLYQSLAHNLRQNDDASL